MKKNWIMRVGVILMALTLITSCFVGGTFAKYVTSGTATDSARVAMWGVTVTATGTTFAEEYETHEGGVTIGTKSVISNGTGMSKVVAPGTDGKVAAVELRGKPEVGFRVNYSAEFELGDNWKKADSSYYCPIIITVEGVDIWGTNYTSADGFEAAVEAAIAAYSKEYAPNIDISDHSADGIEVEWKWLFETPDVAGNHDADDTYLGNRAVEGYAATISLEITTTVTQID